MKNWGGNVTFDAERVSRPATLAEAQESIGAARKVRALGSRHSFNHIGDSSQIIDTTALPELFEVSADHEHVRVSGAMTYGRAAALLAPWGLTLGNFASLAHISIAGAIATGTHGSGDSNPNLAAMVRSIELVTGGGELVELSRGDAEFGGAVVALGALGLVSAVTLDVVPAFDVTQRVYDGGSIGHFVENFDAIFAAGYSVSAFTSWSAIEQIWVKQRTGDPVPAQSQRLLSDLTPAVEDRHPVIGLNAQACTEQLGRPGPAAERLPHFRLAFNPSVGQEIQSEFFVGRDRSAEAIEAVAAISEVIGDALVVGELRTVGADAQWMSPHQGRDSFALHFTWHPDQDQAERAARAVAESLQPFEPRPHWGKVFDPSLFDLGQFQDRARFVEMVDRIDPSQTFSNAWFDEVIRS